MKNIFVLIVVLASAAFGCAHRPVSEAPLTPAAAPGPVVVDPTVTAAVYVPEEPVPAVVPASASGTAPTPPDVYRSIFKLERMAEAGDFADRDAMEKLLKEASLALRTARDTLKPEEFDELADKIGVLTQTLRLSYAERMVERVRYYGSVDSSVTAQETVADAQDAISRAKDAGADVALLERTLPLLAKRAMSFQGKMAAQRQAVAAP